MCSLDSFPSPQNLDERSLREFDEYIESGPEAVFNEELYYPPISIDPSSIIKPALVNEKLSDVFIEKHVSPWKKAYFICRCEGFISALHILAEIRNEENLSLLISQKVSSAILFVWNFILMVYGYFFPYSLLSNDELCAEFSRCTSYNSHIRCFAWHPQFSRCAIALLNDNIFVYSSSNSTIPLVKHPSQKKVTDMTWKPNCEEILAVACQSAVLIWTIDPNSKATRVTCARIIHQSIPTPVTCVAYDPLGEWLAVSSPSTSKVVLLKQTDIIEEKVIRKFGSGVPFLKWSPDKSRLFAATTSTYVRVFENIGWSSRKWSQHISQRCQSACWSADGRILLFALRNDCVVYAIAFYEKVQANDCGGTNTTIQVLDVSEKQTNFGVVGGPVHEMLWDKNGERLVIMFRDNPKFIAVYKTRCKPTLEVTPIGFIHGLRTEIPVLISFHDAFKKGCLLSVCWNSGVVSHIPLQYSPNAKTNTLSHSTPRSLTSFCVTPTRESSIYSPMKSLSNISRLSCISKDSVLSPRKPLLFSQTMANNSLVN